MLPRQSSSAAQARRISREFLDSLVPAAAEETVTAVELVASELVTNTVRHAQGTVCALRLEGRPHAVVVSVADADPRPPRERTPDLTGEGGGFGWPLVKELATTVSVASGPAGKEISVTLPR
ncbi:ATP-binding protein [Streptomyces sp. NPDC060006]|uniref:ATP-binding protein n=1 Tax=unclassified Streptomyces TaxID=2593676 RepID=UPI0036BBEA21